MITEVFGVKGQAGNLTIEPALLKEQYDQEGRAGINLNFAGKRFSITIENKEKQEDGTGKIKKALLNGDIVPVDCQKLVISAEKLKNLVKYNEILIFL